MYKFDHAGRSRRQQSSEPVALVKVLLGTSSLLALSLGMAAAQELPSGAQVTSGTATIGQSGSNLIVNQTSHHAIIGWNSFSIGGSASAHFENGSGATLNRVTGNLPSSIDGVLTATGSVYLINPAGVTVGSGGTVRTGGSFVASTHDVADREFLAGGALTLKGDSKAAVVNRGFVTSLSGDVVLTARRVGNSGTIHAPQGSIGLLAGYEVELRDTSLADGKFAVKIGGGDTEVVNAGTLKAVEIELRANGGSVQALAGNTKGIVKATGVRKSGGRIFLTAGASGTVTTTQRIVARRAVQPARRVQMANLPGIGPLPQSRPDFAGGEVHVAGGTISLGGEIDASGSGAKGGTIIAVAKDRLDLAATAHIDTSGTDGGLILLGGDYQGGSNEATRYHADTIGTTATTLVAQGATVAANGVAGAGGNVVVWGDRHTGFAGTISATGLSKGGDAEVSGKASLAFIGTADLSGATGPFGTLLLDPYNVTISDAPDQTSSGFSPSGADSVINKTRLQNQLAIANVTISTGAGGNQAGDITVASALSWSSPRTLTLRADHSININAPVTISGNNGGLLLVYNLSNTDGTLAFAPGGNVQFTGTTGQTLNINSAAYTIIYSMAALQAITSNAALRQNYALATSLNAATTNNWIPIGITAAGGVRNGGDGFTGTFTGLGNTITGLKINRATDYTGLFGYSTGTIRDIGLVGGSTAGTVSVGGLVGEGNGAIIDSYNTGTVTGGDYVGGLVGYFSGTIMQSYTTGAVTSSAGTVGGLAGTIGGGGSISQSHASGNVQGVLFVGGLVGYSFAPITNSYATGTVTGEVYVGGLVGDNTSEITGSRAEGAVRGEDVVGGLVGAHDEGAKIEGSHAIGTVTGTINGAMKLGGLVGENDGGTIANSYASGAVSRGSTYLGGLVGTNGNNGKIENSYATGAVSTTVGDASFLGGLVGNNESEITASYTTSTATVSATGARTKNVGGLAGTNAGTITASHADGNVTATANSSTRVGGLVGDNTGTITGSDASGTIRGVQHVGGLVGYNTNGTIAASSATGAIAAGTNFLGGLVGYNTGAKAKISGSHATGKVTGGASSSYVGGLVGANMAGGAIATSFATGAVSGGGTNTDNIGGLVGRNDSASITTSYATGNVTAAASTSQVGGLAGGNPGGQISLSYATGTVRGGNLAGPIGGLVGGMSNSGGNSATITQSYATGAVIGGNNANQVGGLVGNMTSGTISQSYATGAVSAGPGSLNVGGFFGVSGGGTVTYGYWDTQTTGQTRSGGGSGITGLTTAQLQTNGLLTGFDGSAWGIGAGLYPYLKSFFPTGVQVVNGFTLKAEGSAMASNANGAVYVSAISGVAVAGSASTGANGYYYIFVQPGTWANNAGLATFTQTDTVTGVQNAVSYRAGAPAALNAYLDISGGWRRDGTGPLTLLSTLDTNYATTIGLAAPSGFTLANREIAASGSFSLDQSLLATGMLSLSSSGAMTQSAIFTAPKLLLWGPGSFVLTSAGNTFDELVANGGSVDVAGGRALTVASGLKNASGITISGATTSQPTGLRIRTTGNLTLASGAKVDGANPVLMTGGAFINNQGSDAVSATSGRWLIYSANPAGNTFNNLDSANTAIWNTAAGDAVFQTGNRYVFASQPKLTIASLDRSKTYGNALTFGTVEGIDYAVDGLFAGMTNAINADTVATALSGAPVLGSNGAAKTAAVVPGGYAITVDTTGLSALTGYNLSGVPTGTLSVNKAVLMVTASNASKVYGQTTTFTGGEFTASGLQNSETIGSVALASTGAAASAGVATYAITAGTATDGTFTAGNYTITYVGGTLTVTPAALVVTASNAGKVYDGQAWAGGNGVTYSGFVNSEGSSVLGGVLAWRGAAQGSKDAGLHTITASGLTSVNYAISYADGQLSVTPRAITISANASGKVYGELDPALGWTVGGTGLVDGDVLSGSLLRVAGETVAAYSIDQGTLAADGNYTLTYKGNDLVITPRSITVSANDFSRLYGNANPTLTWTLTGGSLAAGDSLASVFSGDPATAADAVSPVSAYAITQGGFVVNSNYAMTFTPGTLTVNPRSITILADASGKIYGELDPALGWTVGGMGLANGDVLSGSLLRVAGETVATHAIGRGSLSAGVNYTLTYTGNDFVITPRSITVTANDLGKLLGAVDPALTWTLTSGGLASFDTIGGVFGGTLARKPGEMAGGYAVLQGTLLADANYAMGFVPSTFTIEPGSIVPAEYTDRPGFERQTPYNPLLLSAVGDDDPMGGCSDGVTGPDCAAYVHADNRDLGPYIGMTE